MLTKNNLSIHNLDRWALTVLGLFMIWPMARLEAQVPPSPIQSPVNVNLKGALARCITKSINPIELNLIIPGSPSSNDTTYKNSSPQSFIEVACSGGVNIVSITANDTYLMPNTIASTLDPEANPEPIEVGGLQVVDGGTGCLLSSAAGSSSSTAIASGFELIMPSSFTGKGMHKFCSISGVFSVIDNNTNSFAPNAQAAQTITWNIAFQ